MQLPCQSDIYTNKNTCITFKITLKYIYMPIELLKLIYINIFYISFAQNDQFDAPDTLFENAKWFV